MLKNLLFSNNIVITIRKLVLLFIISFITLLFNNYNKVLAASITSRSGVVRILDEISETLDLLSKTLNSFFISNNLVNNEQNELKSTKQTPILNFFISEWETKVEQKLGRDVHESLRRNPGFSNNPYYLDRIARVASRLVPHCERKDITYRFAVIKKSEVNAFAAPGGYVYVTEGLMRMIESDDELACVIAHELGHINKKHTIRQAEKSGILSILVYLLGLNDETKKYQKASAIAAYFINQKFSRDDEFEADKMAVMYAYKAGYNPYALIRFFQKINRDNSLTIITKYFSSHPPTNERIKRAKAEISKLQNKQIANTNYFLQYSDDITNNSAKTAMNENINTNIYNLSNCQQQHTHVKSVIQNNFSPSQELCNSYVNNSSKTQNCHSIKLKEAYEIYLKKKQIYEEKVVLHASQSEVIKAFQEYQAAKKSYFDLKQKIHK